MEADWEIEFGGEAPVIDACWQGIIDLRAAPERVRELTEVQQLPALAEALLCLNSLDSPVWTSKCDVWTVESFDRFELDATPDRAIRATACYIDLLPRVADQWATPRQAEQICRQLCGTLRKIPMSCCRVDLIVRKAVLAPETEALGITAYVAACGLSGADAVKTLGKALIALADAAASLPTAMGDESKLQ